MKALLTKSVLMLVLFFSFNSGLFAQNSIKDITDHKYALDNLRMGISSENDGVRKSSIYFAGKYRIQELEDNLIEQLSEENNPAVKVLIALALFEMDSEKGMEAVKILSLTDQNEKVRKMAYFIYNESVNQFSAGQVSSR